MRIGSADGNRCEKEEFDGCESSKHFVICENEAEPVFALGSTRVANDWIICCFIHEWRCESNLPRTANGVLASTRYYR